MHCEPFGRLFYAGVDGLGVGVDGLLDVEFVAVFEDPDVESLDPVVEVVFELVVVVELELVELLVPAIEVLLVPRVVVELEADEVVLVSVDVVLDEAVLLLILFLYNI